MNTDGFWLIIDEVHRLSCGNMDLKCDLLKEKLSALNEPDLREFIDHFNAAYSAAYTWPLWGAAYILNGGCSDDSFMDFRATLISQGREVYERAMSDPDSLAELSFSDDVDFCYEGFQYVMNDVAQERLGEVPQRRLAPPDEPAGEEWGEDAELLRLYPRLAAKYLGSVIADKPPKPGKRWWKIW